MTEAAMFYLLAAGMVGSSVAILFSRDIVRTATWLLGTLGSAAGLYFLLSANFLGAVQLIVYAGGVLILIVFGVMLTARQPRSPMKPRRREVLVTAAAGLVLLGALLAVMLGGPYPELPGTAVPVRAVPVRVIGDKLLTEYLVPFEVISVLLLAVMIGAAYLARPEKR